MERKVSSYLRKWLGVPRSMTDVALYSTTAKLQLPTTSLVEEFKVAKARTFLMLRDSKDPVIREAQPDVPTGRKWVVAEAVEQAESRLQHREIMGAVQRDRLGIGWRENRWWSKEGFRGRRELVTEEIRQVEEEQRVVKAVGQAQQGAWTTWEEAVGRRVTWSNLWSMEPLRISILLRSVYDLLPTPVNLTKWKMAESSACQSCGKRATLEHILASCEKALQKYTWRHNQVLKVVAVAVEKQCHRPKSNTAARQEFVKEGERRKVYQVQDVRPKVSAQGEWNLRVDLDRALSFPHHIAMTTQRPDMVLWSDKLKVVLIAELTVPWESNMQWAFERKLARYTELKGLCEDRGWICHVYPIEVGCRGFVGSSTVRFLSDIGVTTAARKPILKQLQEAAESASAWIWKKREAPYQSTT